MNFTLTAIYAASAFLAIVFTCLKWPTFWLVAFMSIYLVKPILVLHFPFLHGLWGYFYDVGVVALALIGIALNNRRYRSASNHHLPLYIWFCIFFLAVWVWFRLPDSRNMQYGAIKALIFSIFNVLVILLGIVCGKTIQGAKIVTRALVVLGLCSGLALLALGRPAQEWEGARMTFGETNPLAPADFAAYAVIILINYWAAKRNLISLAYTLIITPLALIIILLTGARGALFALPFVLVVPFVAFRRPFDFKVPIFLFTLILLLCLAFSQIAGNMIVEQRLNKDSVESGLNIRVLLSIIVFTAWLEAPLLGNGTGDTSVQIDAKFGAISYPHNVLLEIANELGLIGLAPFLVLILFAINGARYLFREMRENNQKWYVVSLFTCFFYQFLLSFKTGSYAGSNMFYFFLGITIALTQSLRYEFFEENIDTHRLF